MKPVSRFLMSVLLLGLLAGPAVAQRAEQIEIGGFGSFTRYEREPRPELPGWKDERVLHPGRVLAPHVRRRRAIQLHRQRPARRHRRPGVLRRASGAAP